MQFYSIKHEGQVCKKKEKRGVRACDGVKKKRAVRHLLPRCLSLPSLTQLSSVLMWIPVCSRGEERKLISLCEEKWK